MSVFKWAKFRISLRDILIRFDGNKEICVDVDLIPELKDFDASDLMSVSVSPDGRRLMFKRKRKTIYVDIQKLVAMFIEEE